MVMKISTEMDLRKRRFWRSLKRIECFNKLGLSWKKGINKYSDLTIDEKQNLFGLEGLYLHKENDSVRMLQPTTNNKLYSN